MPTSKPSAPKANPEIQLCENRIPAAYMTRTEKWREHQLMKGRAKHGSFSSGLCWEPLNVVQLPGLSSGLQINPRLTPLSLQKRWYGLTASPSSPCKLSGVFLGLDTGLLHGQGRLYTQASALMVFQGGQITMKPEIKAHPPHLQATREAENRTRAPHA